MNRYTTARRTLKLVGLAWEQLIGKTHVYDLDEYTRNVCYKMVCKRVAKSVARLRRIGGYQFAYDTVSPVMANDCLYALVD